MLQAAAKPHKAAIGDILKQYLSTAATVLDVVLPYEATPTEDRRPRITDAAASCRNVVAVAHCVRDGLDHKVTLASGFALNVRENGEGAHETLIVTCAHSLEEVSRPPGVPTLSAEHARAPADPELAAHGSRRREPAHARRVGLLRHCGRGRGARGVPRHARRVSAAALRLATSRGGAATRHGARAAGVAVPRAGGRCGARALRRA